MMTWFTSICAAWPNPEATLKIYLGCNFLLCKRDAQLELQADAGGPDGFWLEHFWIWQALGWTECPCSHSQARGKWDSQSKNRELCCVRASPRSDQLTRQGGSNSKAWKRKGTTFLQRCWAQESHRSSFQDPSTLLSTELWKTVHVGF